MAPLCVAGRLPLLPFLCIVLFLLLLAHNVSPLLVYDHLTLWNIGDSVDKLLIQGFSGPPKTLLPLLASILPHLWCPPSGLVCNSRCRRWGRRGGVISRLRAYLASSSARRPPFELSRECASYNIRRSRDPCYQWLLRAFPKAGYPLWCTWSSTRCSTMLYCCTLVCAMFDCSCMCVVKLGHH